MGEADWWLCTSCNSLNNLAARKCYSCGADKPKAAVRASEYLGYRPIVSWDGKVKLEQLTAGEREGEGGTLPGAREQAQTPPLREPVSRDTLAVAPRPPHPARITYRLDGPPLASAGPPVGPAANPVAALPPPEIAGSGVPPAPPLQAVGPGHSPEPGPPAEPWPHWRELLDGPMPHAGQLRDAVSAHREARSHTGTESPAEGMTLRSAIRLARTGDAREFIPWPEEDRGRPEGRDTGEARLAPPPGDRSSE